METFQLETSYRKPALLARLPDAVRWRLARREHSRKPDEAYARIEALCEGPYLEMFARRRRPGWDSWGTEADSGGTETPRWRADSFPDAPEAAD
jgi:MT-A70